MFSYLPKHTQVDFLMPPYDTISKWKAWLISLPALDSLIICGIGDMLIVIFGLRMLSPSTCHTIHMDILIIQF